MGEDNAMLEVVSSLLDVQKQLTERVTRLEETNQELLVRLEIMRRLIDNLPYEVLDDREKQGYQYPRFEKNEEIVRRIREDGASMARFGDGEFAIMRGEKRHEFQRNDERLSERLWQVIRSNEPGLIIGIADNFGSLWKFSDEGAYDIRLYMTREIRAFLDSFVDRNRVYADGYITRFYSVLRDNKGDGPAKRLKQLRSMWEGRDVIMVEGAQTRQGVGNDLFDNTKSIRRIIGPATSSFDRYDEILNACLEEKDDSVLFLIALGPSAGVLAYDLMMNGYQALDIGHLDMEYEWYLAGQGQRTPIPGKYNNEFKNGDQVEDIHDPEYETQIIARCL